jgi:hypothetical protein
MMVFLKDIISHRRPRMAITVLGVQSFFGKRAFKLCLDQDHRPAERVEQLMGEAGITWRRRVLTPMVTMRLFLLQMFHANIAINALRHVSGIDFTAGAYCQARKRLSLWAMSHVLREMTLRFVRQSRQATRAAGGRPGRRRGRVYVVDSTSGSMSDTPPLRSRFGLPSNQKKGIGYPQVSLLGLIDLASGLVMRMVTGHVFRHDLHGIFRVHECLREGDVLLGDRAFCAVDHLRLLAERGVACVFRLNASRVEGRTTKLKRTKWRRPGTTPPKWFHDANLYRRLRRFVTVRLVHYTIRRPGYRSRRITLATTLLDEKEWSDKELAELYARRWEIETCFGHLKTTMRMSVLKCKHSETVMKELAAYLIAYNLIRLEMLRRATREGVDVKRVSFIDTMRALACMAMGMPPARHPILNPARPGRQQLRTHRRRPKHYPWLTEPRGIAQAKLYHRAA